MPFQQHDEGQAANAGSVTPSGTAPDVQHAAPEPPEGGADSGAGEHQTPLSDEEIAAIFMRRAVFIS